MRGDILILLFVSTLFAGCNQERFDRKEDLFAYLKDPNNGYLLQKQVNGVGLSIMLRPTDLLVDQELGNVYTQQRIDSLRKKYSSHLYFNLSISKNGKELLSSQAIRETKGNTI